MWNGGTKVGSASCIPQSNSLVIRGRSKLLAVRREGYPISKVRMLANLLLFSHPTAEQYCQRQKQAAGHQERMPLIFHGRYASLVFVKPSSSYLHPLAISLPMLEDSLIYWFLIILFLGQNMRADTYTCNGAFSIIYRLLKMNRLTSYTIGLKAETTITRTIIAIAKAFGNIIAVYKATQARGVDCY